jgi:hypothetical protein
MAGSGKKGKQILYRKIISPGWYHLPGLKGGGSNDPGNGWIRPLTIDPLVPVGDTSSD